MKDFFGKIADDYSPTVGLINSLDDWVFLRNLPSRRQRALDIGCGSGHLLKLMSRYFVELQGIDNSKGMIKKAKKEVRGVDFVCDEANKLPYQDKYFDYVISHTTFHHLDREKATKEAKRVLKKRGRLVVVDVVLEKNKIKREIEKFLLRYLWSMGRMLLRFGFKQTIAAWEYCHGPIWSSHAKSENHPDKKQFKEFYSKFLPGAEFGTANYAIGYLVWTKP